MRMLLGAAEAGFYPGVILYLTFWFPQRVANRGFSILQIGIPVSLAVANALTSWMLGMDGVAGLAGWRWVFLLQGLPAVLLGAYIFLFLPSRPSEAKWLDPAEQAYLEGQVANQGSAASHEARYVPQALCKPFVWVFSLLWFTINIGFWSLTYFLPTIVRERFEVEAAQSGLLASIPWAFTALAVIFVLWSTSRTGDRKWHLLIALAVAGLGLLTAANTQSPWLALAGLSLGAAGMQSVVPVFWTMTSIVFSGLFAAIAIAVVNSLGNISGLVGPWLSGVLQDATASSQTTLTIMACSLFFSAAFAFVLGGYTDKVAIRRGEASNVLLPTQKISVTAQSSRGGER